MNADGTGLVRLTSPETGDDFDPAYIDEAGGIVFASTRNQIADEYERRSVPQLFTARRGGLDGSVTGIRQITFNESHDQNPFLHSSGRIFFTRWDHLGSPNKMPIFSVNPDGTGQFVAYGADETFGRGNTSGSRTFMEARELRDGGLVSSLMERNSDFEGGAICIINLARFTEAPEILTPSTSPYNNSQKASDALFKTPYPIMDGGREKILVAQSAHEAGGDIENPHSNYDLFIMEKSGGDRRLVHADPANNDFDPVVIAPRAFPVKAFDPDPLVAAGIENKAPTGMFFDADVYSRQNDGQLRDDDLKGLVRFVRVLEAVSTPRNCNSCSETVGNTEFERQRVIGYGDVYKDGSFSIEVPANKALHVQTLDSNAMMLVNQMQWINVMPGERRTCTGCHGERAKDENIKYFSIAPDEKVLFKAGTAEVKEYLAGFHNAQMVTGHASARPDFVNFHTLRAPPAAKVTTIQGILDGRCISCHGSSGAAATGGGLALEFRADTSFTNHGTTNVYETLTTGDKYVTATAGRKSNYVSSRGGARNSPLAWVLYNRQLAGGDKLFRKTSYDHSEIWHKDSAGRIDAFAEENEELLILIEWMDMGIQFMNTVPGPKS